MKKSNPISLFSFQDIITSLTGIMIVVVLVILLQIVESAEQTVENIIKHPENRDFVQKKNELLKQKSEIQKLLESMAQFRQPFSELPESELKERLETEQKTLAAILGKNRELEIKLAAEFEKQRQVVKGKENVQQKMVTLKNEKLNDLEVQKIHLEEECKRLKNEINSRKTHLNIQIIGHGKQTPYIVECSSWGFHIKKWPSGSVITIGSPGEKMTDTKVSRLASYFKDCSEHSLFIVLLLRRNSFYLLNEIVEILYKTNKEIEFGKELLADDEGHLL